MPTDADILRRWTTAMKDLQDTIDRSADELQAAAQRLEQLAEDLRKDGRGV